VVRRALAQQAGQAACVEDEPDTAVAEDGTVTRYAWPPE